MDPYLESRWSDVHAKLIAYIGEALQPSMPPGLRARSEERILLEEPDGQPVRRYRADVAAIDTGRLERREVSAAVAEAGGVAVAESVEITFHNAPVVDRFVRIIDTSNGNRIVTVIEVLSPWNKMAGRLNEDYLRKLNDFARGGVSVVEIDLLRSPRTHLPVTEADLPGARKSPYLVFVQKGWQPEKGTAYLIGLRSPLPAIPIPLRQTDADVLLSLQPLIERVYTAGGHDDIDYARPPTPPLAGEDATWAEQLLRTAGTPSTAR
jgi:hypothetical protein